MKDYKYIYIGIPTINGQIDGFPKIWFSNILENDYLEILNHFNFSEAVIYVVNTKALYIKEIL